MGVILAMTGQAIRRQSGLRDVLGDMAGLAIEIAVSSSQRVARLGVVIITPTCPAIRVVTKRTARPQTSLVMTITVTGFAIQRRAFELQRAMALLAGHDGVSSNQRKTGEIVVKGRLSPTGLGVTLLAAST